MKLKELLKKIDKAKAEIDDLRPINQILEDKIMQNFRLDWNYHSNNIEGNTLTLGETKALILHGLTIGGKPFKDYLEVKGHNDALLELNDYIKGEKKISETAIRALHKLIFKEPFYVNAMTQDGKETRKLIEPGKYKTLPNHVRTATGEMFYFAEPFETAMKMNELMDWYNKELTENNLHPLIFASTLHHKFILIHPFDDGNGRIARIWMNLILMMKGYPPVVIRTKDKHNYYIALQKADAGIIDEFIIYIGNYLLKSLNLYLNTVKNQSTDYLT